MGGAYGWLTGWVAICAYLVANTTIAYLGAPWALALAGIAPTPGGSWPRAWCWSWSCAASGRSASTCSDGRCKLGIAAEAIASVGHRPRAAAGVPRAGPRVFTHTLGAEALSGGSVLAALLAALAVGGWVFIGFDACVGASEETQRRRAARAPRDLDRPAERRRAGDAERGGRRRWRTPIRRRSSPGTDVDPVTTAVDRLVRLVVRRSRSPRWCSLAFLACGMAAQSLTARTDLLGGARRRAARLGLPARASTGAAVADRRDRRSPPSSPASACCSASTRPRWAA